MSMLAGASLNITVEVNLVTLNVAQSCIVGPALYWYIEYALNWLSTCFGLKTAPERLAGFAPLRHPHIVWIVL
jgi:hypothetical protein